MIDKLSIGAAVLLLLMAGAYATAQQNEQQGEQQDEEPTLGERVTALERAVTSLDTRLAARTTGFPPAGDGNDSLAQRVADLERSIAMLRTDLQRADRTAANALRAASDAQRAAALAERLARDAATRLR